MENVPLKLSSTKLVENETFDLDGWFAEWTRFGLLDYVVQKRTTFEPTSKSGLLFFPEYQTLDAQLERDPSWSENWHWVFYMIPAEPGILPVP